MSNTLVEPSTHHPKIVGSTPTTTGTSEKILDVYDEAADVWQKNQGPYFGLV